MKQKSGMIGVVYAAILSAIAGYFFRMTQLSGGSSVPLIAFSILMVFVFALAAVSLEKKSAYEAVYRPSGQDLTFSLLGALGLIAGCVLSFRGSIAQMLVSLLGLLAGLSLGAGAVLRWKEKKPSAAFSVFVVLFYVAKLFRDFRHWEINPAILDYCFSLFAMIAFMLGDVYKRQRSCWQAITRARSALSGAHGAGWRFIRCWASCSAQSALRARSCRSF